MIHLSSSITQEVPTPYTGPRNTLVNDGRKYLAGTPYYLRGLYQWTARVARQAQDGRREWLKVQRRVDIDPRR